MNYALGGLDPWGYHLGNLLLHAATAAVFYVIAQRVLAAAETHFRLDPRLEGARRDLALALDRQADVSKRQGNAAEAERLRQEGTELRAVVPAAKPPIEIPGRDSETART